MYLAISIFAILLLPLNGAKHLEDPLDILSLKNKTINNKTKAVAPISVTRLFCPVNRLLYGRARFKLERMKERFHGDVCRSRTSLDWVCPVCCQIIDELPYCILEGETNATVTQFEGIDSRYVICKTNFINPKTCEYKETASYEKKSPRRSYTGPVDDKGIPHGVGGVMIYPSGATYTGVFYHGRRQGIGTLVYSDASRYTGNFDKGRFQGTGVYMWPDGRKFEGFFDLGYFTNGTYTWNDGRMFTGSFVQDRQHGNGVLHFPDGSKFEGIWEHGQQVGGGKYTFSNSTTRLTVGLLRNEESNTVQEKNSEGLELGNENQNIRSF